MGAGGSPPPGLDGKSIEAHTWTLLQIAFPLYSAKPPASFFVSTKSQDGNINGYEHLYSFKLLIQSILFFPITAQFN